MIPTRLRRSRRTVAARRWLLLPALLATSLVSVPARDSEALVPFAPATVSSLNELVRATFQNRGIVGLSVAVRSDGRSWEAGFGLADIENEVPATPRTVYRFASISKAITAAAVLQCVEQGRIDLDNPIRTYVPQWPQRHPAITVRQLLGHLGGVRWYHGPGEMFNTRHYHSLRESLAQFADDPLECTPGERFVYSSFGYTLLGMAVEGVAGRPYARHLSESVFNPAGMDHARDDDCQAIISHRAAGYYRTPSGRLRNAVYLDTSSRVPGGGLCGTAGDVAAFGAAFLEGRLVRPETVAAMTHSQFSSDGKPTQYGMGWYLSRRDDRPEAWHTGAQSQVSTLLYTRTDRHTVVAILCNLENVNLMELARRLADAAEQEPTPTH